MYVVEVVADVFSVFSSSVGRPLSVLVPDLFQWPVGWGPVGGVLRFQGLVGATGLLVVLRAEAGCGLGALSGVVFFDFCFVGLLRFGEGLLFFCNLCCGCVRTAKRLELLLERVDEALVLAMEFGIVAAAGGWLGSRIIDMPEFEQPLREALVESFG